MTEMDAKQFRDLYMDGRRTFRGCTVTGDMRPYVQEMEDGYRKTDPLILVNCDFSGVKMSDMHMPNGSSEECMFDKAKMRGADLSRRKSTSCSYAGVDFRNSKRGRTSLTYTENISTLFDGSVFYNTRIEGSRNVDTSFDGIEGHFMDFERSTFEDVSFNGANLENIIFWKCAFKNVEMHDIQASRLRGLRIDADKLPEELRKKILAVDFGFLDDPERQIRKGIDESAYPQGGTVRPFYTWGSKIWKACRQDIEWINPEKNVPQEEIDRLTYEALVYSGIKAGSSTNSI